MRNKKYILVSLFNGLGGASIALEQEGLNVIKTYYSEIDKYANQVYQENYPDSIALGDVTKITKETIEKIKTEAKELNAEIILIGGSPCQDLSFQGHQKGISTSCGVNITLYSQYQELVKNGFKFVGQSYLFWEYVRVKKELEPDWFLLENVRMSKKWWKAFDLAIGVENVYFDSSLVSPQSRKRVYWSNAKFQKPKRANTETTKDILEKDAIWGKPNKYLLRLFSGTPRLNRVSDVSNKCHTLTASMDKGNISSFVKDSKTGLVHKLTPVEVERLQGVPDGYTASASKSQRLKMLGNGFEIKSIRIFVKSMKLEVKNNPLLNLFGDVA